MLFIDNHFPRIDRPMRAIRRQIVAQPSVSQNELIIRQLRTQQSNR